MSKVRSSLLILLAWSCLPRPLLAQAPAGPPFQVNTGTNHVARGGSTVSVDPLTGDFVVVWSRPESPNQRLVGQRFDVAGNRRGSEFQVTSSTLPPALPLTKVAHDPSGGFVVVWFQAGAVPGGDIYARRFDAGGAALGAAFRVNTYTTGGQVPPSLARDGAGNFVVVWSTYGTDGDSFSIAGQRFDAAANRIGGEFVVNSYTTGIQVGGAVAMDPAGNSVAVWESSPDGSNTQSSLRGQRFAPGGARVGAEFMVSSRTGSEPYFPSVAMASDGRFVVAWQDYPQQRQFLAVRRFDASGVPQGSEMAVGVPPLRWPRPTIDDSGRFDVAWVNPVLTLDDGRILLQHYRSDGTRDGHVSDVSRAFPDPTPWVAASSDRLGRRVVVWERTNQAGTPTDLWAQRFGVLGASALAVDPVLSGTSDGNGVLEPGETVAVRPAWQNNSGAAQGLTGVLSALSGPAGASYTITDAAASYGTVPAGATQACTDCYAIAVSAPATRPAAHWDATARETIGSPDDGHADWSLHVGDSFADVPRTSGFYRFVESLFHYNITSGCGSGNFCPSAFTTRAQMAVFVLSAKEPAGYLPKSCGATPPFGDVDFNSPFCRWIRELAIRGVTGGCGGGNFCPDQAVSRAQMVVFILRTLDPTLAPPACTVPVFNDVPASSPFCRWVEEAARRGITGGCGGGNFCTDDPVTREQMAVFLTATFGLTLYGP